jgi:hypothetical protein
VTNKKGIINFAAGRRSTENIATDQGLTSTEINSDSLFCDVNHLKAASH